MTLELTPALEDELAKLAAESNCTPLELAQRAVAEYVAYTKQLSIEVDEAEEEAQRDGWILHEQVFEELFARVRKTA